MTKERAQQVIEELVLYEVDSESNSAPSNMELGTAIRVLGMVEAYEVYESSIENLEIVEGDEDED